MTDSEILEAVKERKSITGNFQDGALSGYIADAIEILIDAGVSESIIRSTASLGCITSCVTDMWDNVGGEADFSPLTHKRIAQLVCKSILSESPSKPEANELIELHSNKTRRNTNTNKYTGVFNRRRYIKRVYQRF